ncbi:MAG: hypothetical protein IT256_03795 [Chitinophagaceae bacterium]|nr:hypothetical protein [Chitinophagaceae bacterium]
MKSVVVYSIGSAKPSVAKVLADVLGVSPDLVVKLLYCTPSVLFHKVEETLATNTCNLLSQLGLEVSMLEATDPLPETPELLDVALYVHKPEMLPIIAKQLAEFLGSDEKEALSLLLNEPSIVLGGVSAATANAMSKRIDAEVLCSNPKKDLYTLQIVSKDERIAQQINAQLNAENIEVKLGTKIVENLSYEVSQNLWRRFGANNQIALINQSFQRFEITLDAVDLNDIIQLGMLTEIVGMPHNIVGEIAENLPVALDESVNRKDLIDKMELYENAGLICSFKNIPSGNYNILVDNIDDWSRVKLVMEQFFNTASIPANCEKWQSPQPIKHLISRYIACQLEDIGCRVETQYAN